MKRYYPFLIVLILSQLTAIAQNLIPFSDGKKWGYMQPSGKVVIQNQYDDATPFVNKVAIIKKGELYGLINETGAELIKPAYKIIKPFFSGLYILHVDSEYFGKTEYADKDGKLITGVLNYTIPGANTNLTKTVVYETRPSRFGGTYNHPLYGFKNAEGATIIYNSYDWISNFSGEAAIFRKGDKYGLMNTRGTYVVQPKFVFGRFIGPDQVVFCDEKYNYHVYSGSGLQLRTLTGLSRGKEKTKAFNDSPVSYTCDGVDSMSEGLIRVIKSDNSCGYVDSNWNYVIPSLYAEGSAFRGGLAKVKWNGSFIYINKKGQPFFREEELTAGSQQWAAKDLFTYVFANGDSIYRAYGAADFRDKGLEKKAACYLTTIKMPDKSSRQQLLYNWYAINDPRGLAPKGWQLASESDWNQLSRAACQDSITGNILYATGFGNEGKALSGISELSLSDGIWWHKSVLKAGDSMGRARKLTISKGIAKSDVQTLPIHKLTGLAVRCIRPATPVKPGQKIPVTILKCDSLLVVFARYIQPEKKEVAKTQAVSTVTDYSLSIPGSFRKYAIRFGNSTQPTVTESTFSSSLSCTRLGVNLVSIRFSATGMANGKEQKVTGTFGLYVGAPVKSEFKFGSPSSGKPVLPLTDAVTTTKTEKDKIYYRIENVSGSYCPETGELKLSATIYTMYNTQVGRIEQLSITGEK